MRTSQILELLMTCFYKGEHSLCNNSIPKRRLLLKSWLMKSMATNSRSVKSFFSCNVRIFKEKMISNFEIVMLVLSFFWWNQYRIWFYLRAFCGKPSNKSQDKVRIILGIIQNTKQEYSTFLSCQSTFKMQKAKKWIQQTLLPPMNSIDIITTLRHSWKNAQMAQTRLCYFSGLLC